MEDNEIIDPRDIRTMLPRVTYINSNRTTDEGYFLKLAEFKPEATGSIGIVALILEKTGKICYRDPKSIRFVF
jgi:hypothetical protein